MKPFTTRDAVALLKRRPPTMKRTEIAARATELLSARGFSGKGGATVSRSLASMICLGDAKGRRGPKVWAVWQALVDLKLIPAVPEEIRRWVASEPDRDRARASVKYWRERFYALKAASSDPEEVTEVPMLTNPMLRYFGLERNPVFDEILSERDVWWSAQHKELKSILVEAVEGAKFTRIAGRRGGGKSLIAQIVKRELLARDEVIIVEPSATIARILNEGHLVTSIIQGIKRKVDGRDEIFAESQSPAKRALAMRYLLVQQKRAGRKVALWIDEAHELESRTFLALKRFLDELDGLGRRLLSVVLIGQNPEAAHNPRARDLSEVTLRLQTFRLQPMHEEIPAYLKFKIERAGGRVSEIVSPKALEAIAARCPYPLDANAFFAQLLIDAYRQKEKPVQRHHVESSAPEPGEDALEEARG